MKCICLAVEVAWAKKLQCGEDSLMDWSAPCQTSFAHAPYEDTGIRDGDNG